jgi:glutaminyl-peptide cyclotransferase
MLKFRIVFGLAAAIVAATAQAPAPAPTPPPTPVYGYEVIHTYPHDVTAFTQGLEFREGFLYEGTGLNGRSSVRKEKLETGEVVKRVDLDPVYFGEGITVLAGKIFELTQRSYTGFVYNQLTFRKVKTFNYDGEGWGLANDGHNIYMSDGTEQIRIWDGLSLLEKRRITVHDGEDTVTNINELEWVRGEIYANVWLTDRIARISPKDGQVLGWIDLKGLLPKEFHRKETDVLNGVAYDAVGHRLFVTGKLWPKLYEIKVIPKPPAPAAQPAPVQSQK